MGRTVMTKESARIRVLLVAGRMDVGGIENQLMHLLRKADHTQFQIDFTTTEEHPFYEDEIVSLGGRCIHIPGTEGKRLFQYCKALYRVIREGHYDIVHSNELFHSGMVLLVAKLAGVKCRFVHAHSSNQEIGKGFVRRSYTAVMRWLILHCATQYLSCSTMAAEFLYGNQILDKPNYRLVVNSVETARFLPEDPAHPRDASDGWKTVLQVGRFCDEKNFAFTTAIAAECKKREDQIRFWFVGNDGTDNPIEKEVRQQIAKESLESHVLLMGVRKDVNALMKKADAFILPSKYEGMPLTLIEAQAACLNCVAADTFSHEVDFGVGAIHWLPLTAPVSVWADAVETAVRQEKPARDSVVRAIKEKGFDTDCFAKTICDLYRNAVNGENQ